MRNLCIKRNKAFVGCLAKAHIYIEDAAAADLTLNGISCRYLGELKNGEEKSFPVTENAAQIFVIADTFSKGYCNEVYNLPAGEEDIFLSGQNRYNPAAGNSFRFDGMTDEEVLRNRKKSTRKGFLVLIIAFIIGIIIGILPRFIGTLAPSKPQTFSAEGMQITLTDEFEQLPFDGFTACFGSKNCAVYTIKEEFTLAEGFEDLTLEEYGEIVIDSNPNASAAKQEIGSGFNYFTYDFTNPEDNKTYTYLITMFKAPDAFWIIQFATPQKNMERALPTYLEWAESVTFSAAQ